MKKLADIRQVADYLKQRIDITAVIGSVVRLEKAGPDLHKGLCCFHKEKTPSLTVTPSKGLYHCFGCKASGDIISFYRDTRNLSVVEAIYALAADYNVDISKFERELTEEEKRIAYLQSVNARIVENLGLNGRGAEWLYKERGIDLATAAEFGVCYSPSLATILSILQGVPDDVIHTLDLDRPQMWDDAMVYPLHDASGNVIGFKTRPFWPSPTDEHGRKRPKFLGTSSHSPLHNDHHIYGLHIARRYIKDGRVIGVEGQHDVLTAHSAGIRNVIGTDGTALNKEKLQALEDYGIRELVLVYDGDNAGREASYRVASNLGELNTTISIKIATMPEGEDPDTFIRAHGATAFLKIVHEAVYASQYLIDRVADTIPLGSVTGKIDFVKQVQPVILAAPEYEQVFLIAYVAEKIGIDRMTVEDMIRAEQAKGAKSLLYNLEGEKIVLGEALRDEDFRAALVADMKPEDWYLPKHRTLFEVILQIYKENVPFSPSVVKATANNLGYNQLFQDGAFIDEVYATFGDAETIKADLIDKAIRRRLIREAEALKRDAQDLRKRTVLIIEERISGIEEASTHGSDSGNIDGKIGAREFMNELHKRMQDPGKIVGIDLGPDFRNTTYVLNGLQKKGLHVIAANQSVGKTTLCLNWLNYIAITKKQPWVHFSLEMPAEQNIQKLIGIRAGVDNNRLQRGNITDEEYRRVQQAAIDLHESPIIINDKITTLEGIINETRKLVRSHGIVGVSIDYLQLITIERSQSRKRYEEEGQISGALKNDLAKAFNIPCLALSQLSRRALDAEIAHAEHGAGAYKIAQDSDTYIIIQRKTEDEINQWGIERGNMILNIDKNRMGRRAVVLDMLFLDDQQRMMEVDSGGQA